MLEDVVENMFFHQEDNLTDKLFPLKNFSGISAVIPETSFRFTLFVN
ncbi:hypothetical protein SDC9_197048 [bioreactor metagenome]|uniref:Uncharacterized protein n=1 Tax=bioreactor metagenome TaxID=1076179 RepID=A0A645IDU9_9ZZZZ